MDRVKSLYHSSLFPKLLGEFSGQVGLVLVLIIFIIGIFSAQIAPQRPTQTNILNKLSAPTPNHIMGTDHLGRDLFSRLVFGTRIALLVSFPAISVGILIAIVLGTAAGYSKGKLDNFIVILFDTVRSFPALLFAIAILALIGGASLPVLILVIGITRFPAYGRLIRAQAGRVKENEYVMAAEAAGSKTWRIMIKHILPNVIGTVFIQAAMDIPVVITFEAGLSFLGLGVPPPTPSWGMILRTGYNYIITAPWMVVFSSLFLSAATLGFTLLGEALRDVFDPKLRQGSRL